MQQSGREKFSSRLGFIFVSAGCAVGLGNVWKFPYICGKNGGAAFILLYLVCLFLLGFPILICEFSVGRGSGKSLCQAYELLGPKGSNWKKFGKVSMIGNYLLMMFYTMVAGWMLRYVFIMVSGKDWGEGTKAVQSTFQQMLADPVGMLILAFIVIIVCIGVCALGLKNGVERESKVMMSMLIVLMLVMAVNSVMLKGSGEGLRFYLVPDFQRMKEVGFGNVLFDAMTHAFFTLSVGIGSMEIFGSYLSKDRKITGEAINVMVVDTAIALVAGIIIIPACFAFGVEPDRGPSLLFETLPNVFHHMAGGRIWGALFFVFMSAAALSTVIAVFENIVSMNIDCFGWNRKKAVIVNLFLIAVLSVPAVLGYNVWSFVQIMGEGTTIMDFEDFLVSYNALPLGSLLIVLFCNRKNGWGYESFMKEANTGTGTSFPRGMKFYMSYILPLIILIIYFKGYYDLFASQGTTVLVGWMIVAVLMVLFMAYCAFGKEKSSR